MKRKFFAACRGIATLLACLICLFALYAFNRAPLFVGATGYVFYTGDSAHPQFSSSNPALDKLIFCTAGESGVYGGDCVERIKEEFCAEVCFEERVGGIVNYYCYSPKLKGGVRLNGFTVNLHVAAGEGYTAVGTPLIFGGY